MLYEVITESLGQILEQEDLLVGQAAAGEDAQPALLPGLAQSLGRGVDRLLPVDLDQLPSYNFV